MNSILISATNNQGVRTMMSGVKAAFFGALGLLFVAASPALALDEIYTGTFSDKAVDGYDVVTYFTEGKPREGSKKYTYEWKGAEWRFASEANKALFVANPEKYAPQNGGYCTYAIANLNDAGGDPELYDIRDGKLYLSYNNSIQKKFQKDPEGYISKADVNWPKMLAE